MRQLDPSRGPRRLWDRRRTIMSSMRPVQSFVPSELAVIASLCIWGLILRLPFFFPATIGWDESTLIVMGQGILDGFLPYEKIWQNKPPLAFALFAGAIGLFGKTVVALRFVGCLCVILTSYLVYRASCLITQNKVSAGVAALVSISMTSLLEPEIMTEILCVVPLSAALLLLFSDDIRPVRAFLVGLLIGVAVMIRTNLAVVALAAGAFVIFRPSLLPFSRLFAKGFAYAAGVMLVIATTSIPYLIAGRDELWFDSVVRAGIEFSSHRRSLRNLLDLVGVAFGIGPDGSTSHSILLLGVLLWIGGLVGLSRCAGRWGALSKPLRNGIIAASVFLFGATISVVMTGPPFGHYLVQLIPWFAIFLGVVIDSRSTKILRWLPVAGIGVVLVGVAIGSTQRSYELLLQRMERGKSLAYGTAYEIADYLQTEDESGGSLYMASDHLVYWLLGAYPPTRLSTHPSNIAKPELVAVIEGPNATPESEMRKIVQQRPDFIVKPQSVWYLSGLPEVVRFLEESIARDYTLKTVIEGRQIYQRKPDPGLRPL